MVSSVLGLAALGLVAPARAAPGEDDFGGGEPAAARPGESPATAGESPATSGASPLPARALARPLVERPLTLPPGLFAIIGTGGWYMLGPRDPVVSLGLGARYGVDEDLELGLDLLRLTLSPHPSTGLADPLGVLTYRLLAGTLELGARAELVIPTSSRYGVAASLPLQLHLGRVARFELAPGIRAASGGGVWRGSVEAPAVLQLQLGARLALGAAAVLDLPDLEHEALLARFEARAAWTFGKQTADADLSLVASLPEVVLADRRPADPFAGNRPMVFLELRVYVPEEPRREEGAHLW